MGQTALKPAAGQAAAFDIRAPGRRSADTLFQQAFEHASVGIVLQAPDGDTRIWVNRAFCEMVGATEQELLDEPYGRLTHPDDLPESQRLRRLLIEGEIDRFHLEKRYRHRAGHVVWGSVNASIIRDDDGEVLFYLNYIQDITERKEAEHELRESEQRFRNLIEGSLQGTCISRLKDRKPLFVNQAFVDMFRFPSIAQALLIGSTLDFVAPHDRARITEVRRRRLAGELPWGSVEFDGIRTDGDVIHVQGMSRRLTWHGEEAVQSSYIDITDRRRAERASARARELAEIANRAKTEFLANMSHELRTPLNSIIGFSDILKDQVFGPDAQERYVEYAHDINSSGRHLLDLINDILDVSKIEAGAMDMAVEELDVAVEVSSAARMIRERARNAGVRLACEISVDAPKLLGDSVRIKQVLLNLLSNAVKFTPGGGAVTVAADGDGRGGLRIAVRDTGIGIRSGDLGKLVLPFVQADTSHGLTQEGTGLGLTLVKALTEMHDGTLRIESELGQGSVFTLSFPAHRCIARGA
ncbi:MAG: PAS domain S-box protein [Magnetovibrio sp.]|nr:PAS domain S-box protein [Magnetovibrio sp.]